MCVCVISYWTQLAGGHGVSDLALSPSQTGGIFVTHLRRAVGIRAENSFYAASVPLWNNSTQQRQLEPFPFLLPHVIFADLYTKSPHLFDPLNMDPEDLPPNWWSHSVFLSHGERAVPVSLYSDGVPHTKTDTFYAWYFKISSDPTRHLICTVRKLDVCQCGCRGTCTFGAIQRVLTWSMNALASGNWPTADHMGCDIEYPMLGPLAKGYVGGLAEYRGDLLEMITAFGLKRWDSVDNPCFYCGCSRDTIFDFPESVATCCWADRDSVAFDIMVRRCLKKYLYQARLCGRSFSILWYLINLFQVLVC